MNHILASEVNQPRSLYYRNRQSLPSPRKPNHIPDQYPLIAQHRRNPIGGGLAITPTTAEYLVNEKAKELEIKKELERKQIEIEKDAMPAPMLFNMRSDARTIRSELDRVPTYEMTAGRPHGIEKPIPQLLVPPPSLVISFNIYIFKFDFLFLNFLSLTPLSLLRSSLSMYIYIHALSLDPHHDR